MSLLAALLNKWSARHVSRPDRSISSRCSWAAVGRRNATGSEIEEPTVTGSGDEQGARKQQSQKNELKLERHALPERRETNKSRQSRRILAAPQLFYQVF
jgi:transposase